MTYKIDDLVVIPKSVLENFQNSTFGWTTVIRELQKAKPLKPLIEQSFDAGGAYTIGSHKDFQQIHPNKQTYLEKEIEL